MKRLKISNNFIVFMLLFVFIITGAGMGFGEGCQILSSCHNVQESEISVPTITINGNLHTFQVSESESITFSVRSLGDSLSDLSLGGNLLFLCVLAILSVFYQLIQVAFVLFSRLYVHDRYHMITYMQKQDGRKRVS